MTEITGTDPDDGSTIEIYENEETTFNISLSNSTTVYWYVDGSVEKTEESTSWAQFTVSGDEFDIGNHDITSAVYDADDELWISNSPEWTLEIKENNDIILIDKENTTFPDEVGKNDEWTGEVIIYNDGSSTQTVRISIPDRMWGSDEHDLPAGTEMTFYVDGTGGEEFTVASQRYISFDDSWRTDDTLNVDITEVDDSTPEGRINEIVVPDKVEPFEEWTGTVEVSNIGNGSGDFRILKDGSVEDEGSIQAGDYRRLDFEGEGKESSEIVVETYRNDDWVEDDRETYTVEEIETCSQDFKILDHTGSGTKGRLIIKGSKSGDLSSYTDENGNLTIDKMYEDETCEYEAYLVDNDDSPILLSKKSGEFNVCSSTKEIQFEYICNTKFLALIQDGDFITPEQDISIIAKYDDNESSCKTDEKGLCSIKTINNRELTATADFDDVTQDSDKFTACRGDDNPVIFKFDASIPDCTQRIRVEDQTGSVLPTVKIVIGDEEYYDNPDDRPSYTLSGGEGQINAKEGRYKITAIYGEKHYSGVWELPADDTITITIDTEIENCDQDVDFVDANGNYVGGHILLEKDGSRVTETDSESGQFTLTDLIVFDKYKITGTVELDDKSQTKTESFTACKDSPIELVFDEITQTCSQTIKLVDKNGEPVDGEVTIIEKDSSETLDTKNTSGGSVNFRNLTYGTNYIARGKYDDKEKDKEFTACTTETLEVVMATTKVHELIFRPYSWTTRTEAMNYLDDYYQEIFNLAKRKVDIAGYTFNGLTYRKGKEDKIIVTCEFIQNNDSQKVPMALPVAIVGLAVALLAFGIHMWFLGYKAGDVNAKEAGEIVNESMVNFMASNINQELDWQDYSKAEEMAEKLVKAGDDTEQIRNIFDEYDLSTEERKKVVIAMNTASMGNSYAQADIVAQFTDDEEMKQNSKDRAEKHEEEIYELENQLDEDEINPEEAASDSNSLREETFKDLKDYQDKTEKDDSDWIKYIPYVVAGLGGAYVISNMMNSRNINIRS